MLSTSPTATWRSRTGCRTVHRTSSGINLAITSGRRSCIRITSRFETHEARTQRLIVYSTTLCLLHRAHMPPAGSPKANATNGFEEHAYPSRTIAYQAAAMITSIIENLRAHGELRYTPAFIVYSLFSALIMHVYQMRSSNKSIVVATEQRLQICMDALKEVSKVWLVAKMVHTLFESILGNKHLEERLQKAAGKRHQKNKPSAPAQPQPPPKPPQDAPKRKFDDMDLGFPNVNGPPAPQVSYERSRPQTPAVTPSRELPQQQQQPMPQMTHGSPQMTRQNNDAFMGPSRSGTRPTTPFNPSYSYPGTPPELFLVTRNSPNISQELWQNFQPDQLFPAESHLSIPQISPVQHHTLVDPALSRPQSMAMHPAHTDMGAQAVPQQQMPMGGFDQNNPQAWTQHMDMMAHNQQNAATDDAWSNSSNGRHNPIVPTTLNVEDWYVPAGFSRRKANNSFKVPFLRYQRRRRRRFSFRAFSHRPSMSFFSSDDFCTATV